MPSEYLSTKEVCARYKFSRVTLYRMMKMGEFPKPLISGDGKSCKWSPDQITKYETELYSKLEGKPKMCNCLETALAEVKKNVKRSIKCKYAHESLDVEWSNKATSLSQGKSVMLMPVSVEYVKLKNDDTPYANSTRQSTNVQMIYCPLCGEKLD